MKKSILFALFALFLSGTIFSQRIVPETITYDKQSLPGYSITFIELSVDEISTAMEARLERQAGLKGINSKGFRAYLSQAFPDFGTLQYDIFTKVQKGNKKQGNATILYFLVTKGNNNAISKASDPELVANIEAFLNAFANFADSHTAHSKVLEMNKKLQKLQKDQDKMNSKAAEMKKKIDDNQAEINKLKEGIERNSSRMGQ